MSERELLFVTESRLSELLRLQEKSVKEAWGGKREPARILRGLDQAEGLHVSHMFKDPVDINSFPKYFKRVAFPTDLSTIKERLHNKFYR